MPKDGDDTLAYTSDSAGLIARLKAKGFSVQDIILVLTKNETYDGCLVIARKYAPLLGIKISQFMVLALRRKA